MMEDLKFLLDGTIGVFSMIGLFTVAAATFKFIYKD
jgi:hypothetical protein